MYCQTCDDDSFDRICSRCGAVLADEYEDDLRSQSTSAVSRSKSPLVRAREEFRMRLDATLGLGILPEHIVLDDVRVEVEARGGVKCVSNERRLANIAVWRDIFKKLGYAHSHWSIPICYGMLYGRYPRPMTETEKQRLADRYVDLIAKLMPLRRQGQITRSRRVLMTLYWLIYQEGRHSVQRNQDLLSQIPRTRSDTSRRAFAMYAQVLGQI